MDPDLKMLCDVIIASDNDDMKAMADILYDVGLLRLRDSVKHLGEEYNTPMLLVSPTGVYYAPSKAHLQHTTDERRISGLHYACVSVVRNLFSVKTGKIHDRPVIIVEAGIGDGDTVYYIMQPFSVDGKMLVLGKSLSGFAKVSETLTLLEDRPEVLIGIAAAFEEQTMTKLTERIGVLNRRGHAATSLTHMQKELQEEIDWDALRKESE